jgi:hypothetical protein
MFRFYKMLIAAHFLEPLPRDSKLQRGTFMSLLILLVLFRLMLEEFAL